MHFSGLTIEGFDKGIKAARFVATSGTGNPMIDGCSWKNIRFVNNHTAADITSSNVSNWNIMALSMVSSDAGAVGWHQNSSGTFMQKCVVSGFIKYDGALHQAGYVWNFLDRL